MCFSATASFSAATALLLVGSVALPYVRKPSELPFALIPVLFGVQQLLEGLIWLSFSERAAAWAGLPTHYLVQTYSIFSQVLWPAYVPIAVGLLEETPWRRKVLFIISVAGVVVSIFLFKAMLQNPVTAELQGGHIVYEFGHVHVVAATLVYVLGTCVGPLFSSHTYIRWFGLAAFGSAALAYGVYATWFISVWCLFAGLMSCLISWHFYQRR